MGQVGNGETMHVWEQGVYGKSLPPSQIYHDPKTALKN